jgi:8-oxo-dGTP pyrophosphatase MutT (NUDIX family)
VETLSTRVAYENPWMTVREDEVRWPDGSTGIYGVVEKPDFAVVAPRGDGGWWMVEQYRYTIGRRAWELPQGGWAPGRSGPPEELARLELLEETGLTAERFEHLGHFHGSYGFSRQGFDCWLATGLTEGDPRREATEGDMVHRFVSDDELWAMVADGRVVDAHTLVALALYARQAVRT